jgi:hypothetical protein
MRRVLCIRPLFEPLTVIRCVAFPFGDRVFEGLPGVFTCFRYSDIFADSIALSLRHATYPIGMGPFGDHLHELRHFFGAAQGVERLAIQGGTQLLRLGRGALSATQWQVVASILRLEDISGAACIACPANESGIISTGQ